MSKRNLFPKFTSILELVSYREHAMYMVTNFTAWKNK